MKKLNKVLKKCGFTSLEEVKTVVRQQQELEMHSKIAAFFRPREMKARYDNVVRKEGAPHGYSLGSDRPLGDDDMNTYDHQQNIVEGRGAHAGGYRQIGWDEV